MNVLDAKIINTQYGLEMYLDQDNHIKIEDFHIPTEENPYFDLKIGIEFYCLRKQHHYELDTNYFWLRINLEENAIQLLEPPMQSIFAVKDEKERKATQELIGEWLINTHMFKHSIRELIQQKKQENVTCEEEIRQILRTVNLLEQILELKSENIMEASVLKAI